jgi:outer membrane protein OmpA-like peptidoglycan-associated protein
MKKSKLNGDNFPFFATALLSTSAIKSSIVLLNGCSKTLVHFLHNQYFINRPYFTLFNFQTKTLVTIAFALILITGSAQSIVHIELSDFSKAIAQNRFKARNVVLNGIVKNEAQQPLKNVLVKLTEQLKTYTDVDGKFDIAIDSMEQGCSIFFTYNDSVFNTVRTYHPVMESTFFDVTMYAKKCLGTAIYPIKLKEEILSKDLLFPTIQYAETSINLTKKTTNDLLLIANNLKNNPTVKLTINAYTEKSKSAQLIADKRMLLIENYLIEQLGISADRIKKNKKILPNKNNTIDFTIEE